MSEQVKKIAHLEMIQGVIARMSQNSLTLKELSVGIVSAIFALAASKDVLSRDLCLVAFLPAITFWWLDAFFLCQERKFRSYFDAVRQKDESSIDFSMDTSKHCHEVASIFNTMLSKTLILFHGAILLAIIVFVIIALFAEGSGG
jgi:hypothetical protein